VTGRWWSFLFTVLLGLGRADWDLVYHTAVLALAHGYSLAFRTG
jgi:hypothetical protein